jgi:hypothetical protein
MDQPVPKGTYSEEINTIFERSTAALNAILESSSQELKESSYERGVLQSIKKAINKVADQISKDYSGKNVAEVSAKLNETTEPKELTEKQPETQTITKAQKPTLKEIFAKLHKKGYKFFEKQVVGGYTTEI